MKKLKPHAFYKSFLGNEPYVKKISLKNCGCINQASLELGAINFLYGKNSSGKSTFLRSIRNWAQCIKSFKWNTIVDESKEIYDTSKINENSAVSLNFGNYSNFINRLRQKNILQLAVFSGVLPSRNTFHDPRVWNFILSEGFKSDLVIRTAWPYSLDKDTVGSNIITLFQGNRPFFVISPTSGYLELCNDIKNTNPNIFLPKGMIFALGGRLCCQENPINLHAKYIGFSSTNSSSGSSNAKSYAKIGEGLIESQIPVIVAGRYIEHIKPLRPFSLRSSDLSSSDEKLESEYHPEILNKINCWFLEKDKFNFNQEIRIINTDHKRKYKGSSGDRISIYDKAIGKNLTLSDVGTGVSQILPILHSLFSPNNKLILIEQPEIHLHPAVQAVLMDAIIEGVTKHGHQIILETHSETFLLRTLRRIREKKLMEKIVSRPNFSKKYQMCDNETFKILIDSIKKEEWHQEINSLRIFYFEKEGKYSDIKEMKVDENMRLINDWPGGFFEEGIREVLI